MENKELFVEEEVGLVPQQSGLINETDYMIQLSKKAEEGLQAIKKVMSVALKITTEYDWVLIGGKPYLQESGANKVASLFGVSIKLLGKPTVEVDNDGYKSYTYRAEFSLNNHKIECEGGRSARDEFFTGKQKGKDGKPIPFKKPDEIDDLDVKRSAYTNCLNNGIKRLIPGLRNIDISELEKAGLDTKQIKGYTFKEGEQGGKSSKAEDSGLVCSKCGASVTQAVASFSQGKFKAILCMDCQKGAKTE